MCITHVTSTKAAFKNCLPNWKDSLMSPASSCCSFIAWTNLMYSSKCYLLKSDRKLAQITTTGSRIIGLLTSNLTDLNNRVVTTDCNLNRIRHGSIKTPNLLHSPHWYTALSCRRKALGKAWFLPSQKKSLTEEAKVWTYAKCEHCVTDMF